MNKRPFREPRGLTAYREKQRHETSMLRQLVGLLLGVVLLAGVSVTALTFWRAWAAQSRPSSTSTAASPAAPSDGGGIGDLQSLASRLFVGLQSGEADQPAGTDPTPVKFEIKPGETAGQIADRLQREGLIRDATLFRVLLRVQGADTKLEAGSFELRRTMTSREIADTLQRGRPASATVTIPEGWRAEEIATLLAGQGLVDQTEFIRLVQTGEGFNYPFLPPRDNNGRVSLEGYLFPDTYTFDTSNTDARRVISRMLETFGQRVDVSLRNAAAGSRLDNLQAILTLASIVEREARIPDERPMIAGVYANRLAQNMKLDADPTVQYGMGFDKARTTWWRPLTVEDYKFASPYNTYQSVGLPPGPICNPGLASIRAAISPAPSDFLFFVARRDGSHVFAKTFEEHVRNVNAAR